MRKHAPLHRALRTAQQLRVRPQNLRNAFRGMHPMLRRPNLLRRTLVSKTAPPLHQRHTPHRHQPAHLRLRPQLRQLIPHRRILPRRKPPEIVFLNPIHNILIPPHRNQIPARPHPIQIQPHRPHIPPPVFLPQKHRRRHPHILEKRLISPRHPVSRPQRRRRIALDRPKRTHRDPRRIHRHQKDRYPPMPRRIRIRPRHQIHMSRVMRRRRIHLLPIDHILIPIPHRPALQTRQIRPRLRLRKPQRKHNLPANQPRNEIPLLLLRPRRQNRRRPAARAPDRNPRPRKLLLHDILLNPAAPLPPILPRPANPDPTPLRHLTNQLPVMLPPPPFLGRLQLPQHRLRNIRRNKPLHLPPQSLLLRRIPKIHNPLLNTPQNRRYFPRPNPPMSSNPPTPCTIRPSVLKYLPQASPKRPMLK